MSIPIDPGMISLIIFGIMIIFWSTDKFPLALVSMTGVIACVLLGIVPFPRAMAGFTNEIIFLVAGLDILSQAILKVGLATYIGRTVSRVAKGSEKRLMAISFVFATLMSAFIMNITTIMIFLVIFRGLVKTFNNYNLKNITLPMIAGVNVGGVLTTVGSTPQLVGQSLLQDSGLRVFTLFEFTPVALAVCIAVGLAIYFYSYDENKNRLARAAAKSGKLPQGDSGSKPDASLSEESPAQEAPPSVKTPREKAKTYTVVGISALLLTLLVTGIVSFGTAALAAGLLCIITGCVSQKEALKNLNWNVIIWLAGIFSIASIMDYTGGTEILASAAVSLIPEGIPPFLFFAMVLLIVMSIAQVVSDTACVLIFMPVFLPMAMALDISPYPIALAVIFGASLSYLTPLASGQIALALTVGYNFREIVRFGWRLHILMYIVLIITIPLFFPL